MLLGVLAIALAGLQVLSLFIFGRKLDNPFFIYNAGFLLSAFFALLFARTWQFTLHYRAFLVILLGSGCFLAVCVLTRWLLSSRISGNKCGRHFSSSQKEGGQRIQFLPIYRPFIIAYAIFGMVVIAWTLFAISQLYPADTLAASVAARKYSVTFTTDDGSFFFPLNQLRSLYSGAGYVVTYLVAQEFARRRLSKCPLLIISYIVLFAFMMTTGARTDIANNLTVLILCYLLTIDRGGEQDMRKVSMKTVVVLLILVISFILGYQFLAVGRGKGGFSLDNLGAYLGAEICNLDTFLENAGQQTTGIFGYMTFIRTINYLGGLLGISEWIYPLDLPFLTSNGHWMGNVYSTYYAFVYDFGYVGILILIVVMSFISQIVYEKASEGGHDVFMSTLLIIIYGYIGCNLLFCFFSNRFYENVVSINFVRFFAYVAVSLLIYLYLPKMVGLVKSRCAVSRN